MIPVQYDFSLTRGTTQPFVFRLKLSDGANPPVLTNMPFDDVIITIKPAGKGAVIRHKLSDTTAQFAITDAGENEITFTPTAAETRRLAQDQNNPYEVEVRNGTSEQVYLRGDIFAIGGINSDG
jgi:hypothetical protein